MKRLIVGLIVLVGVLVGVDFGAAALAESAVSRQMREQIGLPDDPDVRINGFPFVTQALAGRYSSIDVAADRLQVGMLQEVEVVAQLRDVQAPLSEVLGSGPKSLRAAEADGTVRVGADDLERLLGDVDRLRIESLDAEALEQAVEDGADPALADADPDTVARLVGTTAALGEETEVTAIVALELTDGLVRIVPRDIRLGGPDAPPLPESTQSALRDRFTVDVDPGSLPLQVTPTELRAVDGVLEISGSTTDLVLGAAATTSG
ncbi:LmeA family phospholipid-binding protein [Pseudonocardia hydrocarbonoxydans]|uniref:DUF2993 domain-containing protein n=1 Tax=Pseudonocardia hydrocarbonoxydans TaxID=76726 RepID=A0A4Y3WTD6_9PSEU|nr:DUF2993 domain-containing protein [Pseudonocardia hydrocarbonoxydans]GEC22155.1 hypothetical protein PHY01_44380 [Pseudonocardia hydrocarbonoxydans]